MESGVDAADNIGPVPVEQVLCTPLLSSRGARSPRQRDETAALGKLIRQLARNPRDLLQTLVEEAMAHCGAGSAGVSLLEPQPDGTTLFRWVALAGEYAPFVGGTTPRDFSPCGVCLDENRPILLSYPARCFTYFQNIPFEIVEALVLPLRTDEEVLGTIWILSHDPGVQFDSEDVRVMSNLADFTAAALRLQKSTQQQKQAERRQAILLKLLQGQREGSDAAAMMYAASEAVGAYLKVDRVAFFEMAQGGNLHFLSGWTAGRLPLLEADFPASWIGTRYLREVLAGKTLGIGDARIDPLTEDSRFADIGTISLVGAPIMRDGMWRAGFYVNHAEPRVWDPEEIALVREVADITWDAVERVHAESALRKSEERLGFALDAGGGIGAWDWDIPNDRVYSSEQFASLFSVNPQHAAAGAPLAEFVRSIHPDDARHVGDAIQQAIQTGGNFSEEYRILQGDGSARWVFARGRCQFDPSGRPVRFPGVIFDISDRKRAEEQLREQWSAFDTALSNTPDFTYTFDLEGRFTYINRALLALWQIPLSEAVGKNFFDLNYPTELAERLQRQIQQVIDTKQKVRDLTPFTGPTGETRHYEYIFVPVISANGEVEGVAGSTRDITEQRQSQERERETQEQLRESARLESLGVMAGGIAHDFNNLLVGILGNASLLVEISPDDNRSLASDIVLAAERAAELTKQMLAYSGRGQFVVERLDLNKLILENFTLLRASISRAIRVELNLSEEDCFIEADRAQIQQVIMNLLINASEAIQGSAGVISVRTKHSKLTTQRLSEHLHGSVDAGQYISMEIADNGSGMSAETIKRIFDPFFTTKFTGRGLGLAAVLGIVKGHRGDVEVRSQPGTGATFTILWPECSRPDAEQAPSEPAVVADFRSATILMADDEETVLRTATAGLQSRGFRVLTAADGKDALEMLCAHPEISLVVLDLTMPVMTGDKAIPLIRSLVPQVPIILSSGYTETEVSRRFHVQGIAGFLQKPYTHTTLIAKITEILEGHPKLSAH
jgi:two-component system cell cycle sensor histidine kinase/response regulator CckA